MLLRSCGLTAIFLVSFSAQAWEQACKFEDRSSGAESARGSGLVSIHAKAGFLEVVGDADAKEVSVDATACASSEKLLKAISWSLRRDGNSLLVDVSLPEIKDSWGKNSYAYLDLTVTVPRGSNMDIVDSSGSLTVKDVGSLRVRDSSGSIDIDGVEGSLTIDDSSGSIEVRNVSKHVDIDDGSGSISVEKVDGSVRLNDGSGSIDVEDVRGDVVVMGDGSGSISVTDVKGNFVVQNDGSGSISHRRVAGEVRLPRNKSDY